MSVDGLRFTWRDQGTIGGVGIALTAGDPVPALPLDLTTGLQVASVAASATTTLWQATASPLTSFDFLYIMAGDYPTEDALDTEDIPALVGQLELTCNDGANERIWFEQMRSGFPYRRFSDVGVDGTSVADVIDLIRFVNNTAAAVTVRFLLATVPA